MSAEALPTPRRTEAGALSPARLWAFRLIAAIIVPAAILLVLEASLRLAGFGQPVRFLIPDEKPGYFRTNPEFVASFLPSSFDLRPLNFRVKKVKDPNTVRIVVLGESAAQGIPAPAFGFAPQLRALLRNRYRSSSFEVLDTGIVAINSHVVYQIAREMAGFSPDVFVVYMGNNEVVGPYGPGCAYLSQMPPLWFIRLSVFVRSTRTGQLAAHVLGKLHGPAGKPQEWGGMSMFVNSSVRGDDPRLEAVYRNFEVNLRDLARVASSSGARTILCTVGSNIRDCAPLLSLHGTGLAGSDVGQWEKAFNRGRIEWLLGDAVPAKADLTEALRLDPQYADTSFMLGSLAYADGDVGGARRLFIDAEHWDALRFRPDPRINEAIRKVAAEGIHGVEIVDVARELGSSPDSTTVPAGRGIFFEHVHLDWDGNYAVARLLAEAVGAHMPTDETQPWLNSEDCAREIACTDHERSSVLLKVEAIIQNPPFTNQLTYVEDEARLARDLVAAGKDAKDPEKLGRARSVVRDAEAKDPGNPDLAKIAEEIADDSGDLEGALADCIRSQELQPASFALGTDAAIKLSRLGRFDESEKLLRTTSATCTSRDLVAMAPAFTDLFTRTKRFDEGRRFLDQEIQANPADMGLRVLKGRLAGLAGDTAGAEAEYRAVLALDPSDTKALEELVGLLAKEGRADDAEKSCLDAAASQPRNAANNLRTSILYDMRKDDAHAAQFMAAAERSGPVTYPLEMNLARKLFTLGRPDEGLEHLALARRVSLYAGDPAATALVDRVISQVRAQMR